MKLIENKTRCQMNTNLFHEHIGTDGGAITTSVLARLPEILATFRRTTKIDNMIDTREEDEFLPGSASIMFQEPQDARRSDKPSRIEILSRNWTTQKHARMRNFGNIY